MCSLLPGIDKDGYEIKAHPPPSRAFDQNSSVLPGRLAIWNAIEFAGTEDSALRKKPSLWALMKTKKDEQEATQERSSSFRVIWAGGAIVREDMDLSSNMAGIIPPGTVVEIVEKFGRRGRVTTPLQGWISLATSKGVAILEPVCADEQHAQQQAPSHINSSNRTSFLRNAVSSSVARGNEEEINAELLPSSTGDDKGGTGEAEGKWVSAVSPPPGYVSTASSQEDKLQVKDVFPRGVHRRPHSSLESSTIEIGVGENPDGKPTMRKSLHRRSETHSSYFRPAHAPSTYIDHFTDLLNSLQERTSHLLNTSPLDLVTGRRRDTGDNTAASQDGVREGLAKGAEGKQQQEDEEEELLLLSEDDMIIADEEDDVHDGREEIAIWDAEEKGGGRGGQGKGRPKAISSITSTSNVHYEEGNYDRFDGGGRSIDNPRRLARSSSVGSRSSLETAAAVASGSSPFSKDGKLRGSGGQERHRPYQHIMNRQPSPPPRALSLTRKRYGATRGRTEIGEDGNRARRGSGERNAPQIRYLEKKHRDQKQRTTNRMRKNRAYSKTITKNKQHTSAGNLYEYRFSQGMKVGHSFGGSMDARRALQHDKSSTMTRSIGIMPRRFSDLPPPVQAWPEGRSPELIEGYFAAPRIRTSCTGVGGEGNYPSPLEDGGGGVFMHQRPCDRWRLSNNYGFPIDDALRRTLFDASMTIATPSPHLWHAIIDGWMRESFNPHCKQLKEGSSKGGPSSDKNSTVTGDRKGVGRKRHAGNRTPPPPSTKPPRDPPDRSLGGMGAAAAGSNERSRKNAICSNDLTTPATNDENEIVADVESTFKRLGAGTSPAHQRRRDSISAGFAEFGKGIAEGVGGVILDPILGARDGGVQGFLNGLGTGLVGFVRKPSEGLAGLVGSMDRVGRRMAPPVAHSKLRSLALKGRLPDPLREELWFAASAAAQLRGDLGPKYFKERLKEFFRLVAKTSSLLSSSSSLSSSATSAREADSKQGAHGGGSAPKNEDSSRKKTKKEGDAERARRVFSEINKDLGRTFPMHPHFSESTATFIITADSRRERQRAAAKKKKKKKNKKRSRRKNKRRRRRKEGAESSSGNDQIASNGGGNDGGGGRRKNEDGKDNKEEGLGSDEAVQGRGTEKKGGGGKEKKEEEENERKDDITVTSSISGELETKRQHGELDGRSKEENMKNSSVSSVCSSSNSSSIVSSSSSMNKKKRNRVVSSRSRVKGDQQEVTVSGIMQLKAVLCALSEHRPDIGYCQCLNYLAAVLLLVCEPDTAFWILAAMIDYVIPEGYFSDSLIGAVADTRVLQVWDLVIIHGSHVLFWVSLAVLHLQQERVLSAQNEGELYNVITTIGEGLEDENALMDAILKFRISKVTKQHNESE
eukprot:jgi/Bigna1/76104/fgenesh1_pg.39_\